MRYVWLVQGDKQTWGRGTDSEVFLTEALAQAAANAKALKYAKITASEADGRDPRTSLFKDNNPWHVQAIYTTSSGQNHTSGGVVVKKLPVQGSVVDALAEIDR